MNTIAKIKPCEVCGKKTEYVHLILEIIPNFGVHQEHSFLCKTCAENARKIDKELID